MVTVTVNATPASGGGGSNQNPQQQQQPQAPQYNQQTGQQQPPFQNTFQQSGQASQAAQTATSASQVGQQATGQQPAVSSVLPTSDRLVNDVRAEITRRGVIMVPGTQNFSTTLNAIQQNQRSAMMGSIEDDYNSRLADIDIRRERALRGLARRNDIARRAELKGETDPDTIDSINKYWDKKLESAQSHYEKEFQKEYDALDSSHQEALTEAENRLTDAMKRLTEELSQGNKDSYLGQLREKYKEQIWRRDNAETEEEVREANKEAKKIQERIQRAQEGGMSPTTMRLLGAVGTGASVLANAAFQSAQISDRMAWGLGLEQSSSILSGNAFQAIRQRNAYESQQASTWWGAGGAAAGAITGAAIGSMVPVIGTVVGGILGGLIGGLGGQAGAYYFGGNRERLREDYRVQASDLWRQEEQRMMQFNELAMLTRGDNFGVQWTRNWYINQAQDSLMRNAFKESDGRSRYGNEVEPIVDAYDAFNPYNEGLDLYDLGYTSPEFAQQASRRIKQRGFVDIDSITNAMYADALERVFSMSSGALGNLSQYDRFGKNNANQDFANLALTLERLNTTGMSQGAWARSDEFAGYMTSLQQQQRSTFLTVDNERAARQVATGQAVFGDKFGSEALQGIQQINNAVQNPGGGFQQTLLYDVIQELFPNTRGRIDLIEQAQFDPSKQNAIQQEYYKRLRSIYGDVDTASGYFAMKETTGIQNPNVMMPLVRQLLKGGLEAQRLENANQDELVRPITEGGYTTEVTKSLNIAADNQMSLLLNQMDNMISISRDLLRVLREDTNETLKQAVKELGK